MTMLGVTATITSIEWRQWNKPRSGDLVEWPNGSLGRIDGGHAGWVDDETEFHVCESQGSAFMHPEDGLVDISGGPFVVVKREELVDQCKTAASWFWNWGDHRPAAGMAVHFGLVRPVWKFTGTTDRLSRSLREGPDDDAREDHDPAVD